MNTTKQAQTITVSFLLQHAYSLIAYAQADADFAETLAHYVQHSYWHIAPPTHIAGSIYTTPTNRADAVRTTNWLLQQLEEQPLASDARAVLSVWADTYKEPKSLVLGIVGLAIIGPTLGLIASKKKKKTKLQLVVDTTWFTSLTPDQVVAKTHALSQQTIAKELRLAHGKMENLHPDTADWCMAGSGTKLYQATKAEMAALQATLTEEQLVYSVTENDKKIVAIGISPSIQDRLVEETIK